MKRFLWGFPFFLLIFIFNACANETSQPINQEEIHADWANLTFNQMMDGQSDLVVLAHVSSVKNIKGEDERQEVQLAELIIQEVFFGEPSRKSITLYQSIDKVRLNSSYLLFLQERPEAGVYVVSDANSQTVVLDGNQPMSEKRFEVNVIGIEGTYSKEELHKIFENYN